MLKQNLKEVWERHSHAFPPHYTPAHTSDSAPGKLRPLSPPRYAPERNAVSTNIRFVLYLSLRKSGQMLLSKLCELILPRVDLLGLQDVLILRTSLHRIKFHSNISC